MINPYIGHPSQLYGVEEVRLVGGKGDGMRLLQVHNAACLAFTVAVDRCADVYRLSFKGDNMGFFSANGYVGPAFYQEQGKEFLKSFTAGFFTTCGLNNVGAPCNRIQTQFLEALGMEMPRTIDELYNFLVGIRDNDVNGNGDPSDEIPLTTFAKRNHIFQMLSNAWQYTDIETYLKVNDGKVSFIGNNEYFKETLEFMKKLVDEKLLDPASFTQDESVMATLLAQEGNNVGIYGCGNMYTNSMDSNGDEYQNMRMLPNLEGPHGYKSSIYDPAKVRISGVVTSACENVDAAFRFLDFCLSPEAGMATRVGFEGKEWAKATEGMIGRDGKPAKFYLLTTQEWVQPSTNVIWDSESFIVSSVMNGCEAAQTAVKYPTSADIVEWKYVEENTYERLPQLLMSAEDSSEYEELRIMIKEAVDEAIATFVLGDRDLAEFDDYCAELESMGLDRYIELAQAAVDAL